MVTLSAERASERASEITDVLTLAIKHTVKQATLKPHKRF